MKTTTPVRRRITALRISSLEHRISLTTDFSVVCNDHGFIN